MSDLSSTDSVSSAFTSNSSGSSAPETKKSSSDTSITSFPSHDMVDDNKETTNKNVKNEIEEFKNIDELVNYYTLEINELKSKFFFYKESNPEKRDEHSTLILKKIQEFILKFQEFTKNQACKIISSRINTIFYNHLSSIKSEIRNNYASFIGLNDDDADSPKTDLPVFNSEESELNPRIFDAPSSSKNENKSQSIRSIMNSFLPATKILLEDCEKLDASNNLKSGIITKDDEVSLGNLDTLRSLVTFVYTIIDRMDNYLAHHTPFLVRYGDIYNANYVCSEIAVRSTYLRNKIERVTQKIIKTKNELSFGKNSEKTTKDFRNFVLSELIDIKYHFPAVLIRIQNKSEKTQSNISSNFSSSSSDSSSTTDTSQEKYIYAQSDLLEKIQISRTEINKILATEYETEINPEDDNMLSKKPIDKIQDLKLKRFDFNFLNDITYINAETSRVVIIYPFENIFSREKKEIRFSPNEISYIENPLSQLEGSHNLYGNYWRLFVTDEAESSTQNSMMDDKRGRESVRKISVSCFQNLNDYDTMVRQSLTDRRLIDLTPKGKKTSSLIDVQKFLDASLPIFSSHLLHKNQWARTKSDMERFFWTTNISLNHDKFQTEKKRNNIWNKLISALGRENVSVVPKKMVLDKSTATILGYSLNDNYKVLDFENEKIVSSNIISVKRYTIESARDFILRQIDGQLINMSKPIIGSQIPPEIMKVEFYYRKINEMNFKNSSSSERANHLIYELIKNFIVDEMSFNFYVSQLMSEKNMVHESNKQNENEKLVDMMSRLRIDPNVNARGSEAKKFIGDITNTCNQAIKNLRLKQMLKSRRQPLSSLKERYEKETKKNKNNKKSTIKN